VSKRPADSAPASRRTTAARITGPGAASWVCRVRACRSPRRTSSAPRWRNCETKSAGSKSS